MTGWLKGLQAATAMWSLRSSPAGWLGIVMAFAGVLWLVSDLAVSGLVVTVDIVTRCPFNTTCLYSVISAVEFTAYVGALNSGALFKMVSQAQLTSVANGGLDGIYLKVNGDANFRADDEDVIGQWNCEQSGGQMVYPDGTNPNTIIADLTSRGLLFTESLEACWQIYPDNSTGHLTAWSASQPARPTAVWSLQAAIALPGNFAGGAIVQTYSCNMDAPSVNWVNKQILVDSMLQDWCNELKGDLYSNTGGTASFLAEPVSVLESLLETIVMVSGTAWNLTESPIQDPTQGCLAPRAQVPLLVLILAVLVFVITLAMTVYWVSLGLLIRHAEALNSLGYARAVKINIPDGLLGWMRHAVREKVAVRKVESKDLKEWVFAIGLDGTSMRVRRKDGESTSGLVLDEI